MGTAQWGYPDIGGLTRMAEAKKIIPHTAHGGDLGDLSDLVSGPVDPREWLDLSTGINPNPYPDLTVDMTAFHRLPSRAALDRLRETAVKYYRAKDNVGVVAGAGSQALLQILPALLPGKEIGILGFTYGEHERVWMQAERRVEIIDDLEQLARKDIAIIVNPNNPDGRHIGLDELRTVARMLTGRGGHLIVDEAFGDLIPDKCAVDLVHGNNVIVLKSVGKFFGLAGIRVGFALIDKARAANLENLTGPWPLNGPAIEIATRALSDQDWQHATRDALARFSRDGDRVISSHGLKIIGGCDLFKLAKHDHAEKLFNHLLTHKIYVRRFPQQPALLRFGMPGNSPAFTRLENALSAFQEA